MKKYNKIIAVILVLSLFCLCSCHSDKPLTEETTTLALETTTVVPETTTLPESTTVIPETTTFVSETTTLAPETTTVAPETTTLAPETTTLAPETTTVAPETTTLVPETTTLAPETTTLAPETTTVAPETTTQQTKTDYTSFSKAQIVSEFVNAVNKTKAYTGDVQVFHKESFDSEVVECIGGSMVATCLNYLLGLVVKPGEATYSFSGGTAVNEEAEVIPMLLPVSGNCVLPESGVKSAVISEENELIHIYMVLVEEHAGMGEVPTYNAGSIGYLDTTAYSFNILTITEADIGYTGSEIDAYITPDGYIDSVEYTVNLLATGAGNGLGISGSATLVGAQTELWDVLW